MAIRLHPLYHHAEHGEWEDLISRCESHPDEASYCDILGRTALHRACSRSPPTEAVAALLLADESAAALPDRGGKLPLHYAVSGSSLVVVQALIYVHPHSLAAADDGLWVPLHTACFTAGCRAGGWSDEEAASLVSALSNALPDTLLSTDDNGRTPLHLACLYGAPTRVVGELLAGGAKGVGTRVAVGVLDRMCRYPLHLACQKYDASEETVGTFRLLISADRSVASACDYDGLSCLEILVDTYETPIKRALRLHRKGAIGSKNGLSPAVTLRGILSVFWQKATLLLYSMSHEYVATDESVHSWDELLHDSIRLASCPKVFIMLVLCLRPDLVRMKNACGNLPLHVAVSTKIDGCSNSDILIGDGEYLSEVLDALLDAYPAAACIPTCDGKLPLQLAIECGKKWGHGTRAIFRAYPQALHSAVENTGLIPYFLALRIEDLTEIFLLLKSMPEIIIKLL